jgi:hypothetical protein
MWLVKTACYWVLAFVHFLKFIIIACRVTLARKSDQHKSNKK